MDTKQELTFDEDLSTIVSQLPPPVRAFFASGKVETVAKNLMRKNQLHVDQGAVVEREIILLLLGLKNPDEFAQTFAEEAKLGQQTVNGIMQDINEQIFVPLRDEMRKVAPVAPEQSRTFFHLENKIPLPRQNRPTEEKSPQVLVPAQPVSQKPALRDVLESVMKAPPDGKQVSTEPHKLLEDHEEPHIEFKNKVLVAVPNIVAPAVPSEASPPHKPVTSYSIDPYREPLDEK